MMSSAVILLILSVVSLVLLQILEQVPMQLVRDLTAICCLMN